MASSGAKQFGNPPWTEKIALLFSALIHMPVVLVWTLITSPFHRHNQHKSWKRVLGDKVFYHLTKRLNVKQLQYALGTTHEVYMDWTKRNGLPAVIDELGEDSRLLWIGQKRTDRVILYFHGGAYLISMQFFATTFWKHTIAELKRRNIDTGLAILNYSLVPTATFPTQLKQAVLALEHLISTGVNPQNIQITGDSAGAGLALQLLSHILHPLKGVPRVNLSAPIRGVYLMSPWVSLTTREGSMMTNDDSDVIGPDCLGYWGAQVLAGIPESQRGYIEPVHAPNGWFKKLDTVVDRVLITAGDAECLRDVIARFNKIVSEHHGDTKYLLQEHGVHNDPYFDFLTMDPVGWLTPYIWDWFEAGFKKS